MSQNLACDKRIIEATKRVRSANGYDSTGQSPRFYPDTNYRLKVEMIDVDLKTEKQLNIVLNNSNVGGQGNLDALARIIPEIDNKDADPTEKDNIAAYVMLSFETFKAKAVFCERFGYYPYGKFIKGEVFDGKVERIV